MVKDYLGILDQEVANDPLETLDHRVGGAPSHLGNVVAHPASRRKCPQVAFVSSDVANMKAKIFDNQ